MSNVCLLPHVGAAGPGPATGPSPPASLPGLGFFGSRPPAPPPGLAAGAVLLRLDPALHLGPLVPDQPRAEPEPGRAGALLAPVPERVRPDAQQVSQLSLGHQRAGHQNGGSLA